MYLTASDYLERGGEVIDEAAYTLLEWQARKYVDLYTQNRLKSLAYGDLTDDVKNCMALVIKAIREENEGQSVTSFSNDGVSILMAESPKLDDKVRAIITMALPAELIYRGCDNAD